MFNQESVQITVPVGVVGMVLAFAGNKRGHFRDRAIHTNIYLYQFRVLPLVQLLTQEIFFDSCCMIGTVIAKGYVYKNE